MSGGLPPSTAVLTTVGTLSPAEVYFTLTFGYVSLNLSITAWKDFCSSPVQMPTTETDPDTFEAAEVDVPPLPQPAAATRAAAAATASRWRWTRCVLTGQSSRPGVSS